MIRRMRRIRRNGQQYSLFFIRPKENSNAHKYAERLASMEGVAEVMVTEGECGFVVKAKEDSNIGEKSPILTKNSYKRLVSYYQYKK